MPNRIIKESICTSDEVDRLTADQEVFFYRLMVNVDDYGLLDARPKILASKCFPLKSIDIKKIEAWLQALADVGLIRRYEVDGLPYLAITKWAQHQQIRAKRPKYPSPESGSEIICDHVQSNVPVIQSKPIQSESESNQSTLAKPKRASKPFSGKPVDVSDEVWASFVSVRNKKRAAITDLAILKIRAESVKADITLEEALTICCERGWAGFEAEWIEKNAPRQSGKPNANAALFASMTHLHNQIPKQEEHRGRTIDVTPRLD